MSSLQRHKIPKSAIAVNSAISTIILYLVFTDLVLVLTSWLLGLLIFAGIISLSWFSVALDDGLNPWIRKTEMDWTNFFTTKHYNTWLYLNDAHAWFILNTFFFLPVSLSFATFLVDPLLGVGLTVLSFLLGSLILVLVHLLSTK